MIWRCDPEYQNVITRLKKQLKNTREALDETDEKYPGIAKIVEEHWNEKKN